MDLKIKAWFSRHIWVRVNYRMIPDQYMSNTQNYQAEKKKSCFQ